MGPEQECLICSQFAVGFYERVAKYSMGEFFRQRCDKRIRGCLTFIGPMGFEYDDNNNVLSRKTTVL